MVLLVCVALAYFTPRLKPTPIYSAILKMVSIVSFVFFLFEATACILVHGFVRGKDAYLRRNYFNILSLLLLIV